MIALVGDVNVSGRAHGYGGWRIELRRRCRTAVAAESGSAGSGNCRYLAGRRNAADDVIVRVGYIETAGFVSCHTQRRLKLRIGGRAAIASVSGLSGTREGPDLEVNRHLLSGDDHYTADERDHSSAQCSAAQMRVKTHVSYLHLGASPFCRFCCDWARRVWLGPLR